MDVVVPQVGLAVVAVKSRAVNAAVVLVDVAALDVRIAVVHVDGGRAVVVELAVLDGQVGAGGGEAVVQINRIQLGVRERAALDGSGAVVELERNVVAVERAVDEVDLRILCLHGDVGAETLPLTGEGAVFEG